jgi:hypothetical protein
MLQEVKRHVISVSFPATPGWSTTGISAAAFEKNRRPYAGSVVFAVPLYVEYNSFCAVHDKMMVSF